MGKQTPHSGVSHHMLGLWTIMWSQPQNRWSSPSCVWDFPWSCSCSVQQAGGELVWHGDMRDLYLRRPVKRSPLSLSKGSFFIQSSYMLHVFIKPGEIWASLKNRSGNFFLVILFFMCVLWAGRRRTWSGLVAWWTYMRCTAHLWAKVPISSLYPSPKFHHVTLHRFIPQAHGTHTQYVQDLLF